MVPFKKRLGVDDAHVSAFVMFWEAFAAHFSKFDPERVFLEVLNEPEIHDIKRWNAVQTEAAKAIRRSAPAHTIIVSGDEWSQLPILQKLEPPDDRNIICNFHLYDPLVITHQGAPWSQPWLMCCKGMTYPGDPEFIRDFLKTVTDPVALRYLHEYESLNWNMERYEKILAPAAEWARSRGVALTCNEFGVYRVHAPRATRLAWLRDVTNVLARNQIGWCMWDYAGDFGVVEVKDGKRVPDRDLLEALGL